MNATQTNHPARAVLYTRVSSLQQVEGTSLESQLSACLLKAQQLGAVIVTHREDAGVSGAKYEDRPGLQAALADIEAGRADTFITYDLSRYSRDGEHQLLIKRRIEAAGGRLVFCTMEFQEGADGELAFDLSRAFPVWERRKFRERSMRGKAKVVESGRQPFRTRDPYGYHVIGKNDVIAGKATAAEVGTYVIVSEQAEVAQQMFIRYASGDSLRTIRLWLDASNIPTVAGGKQWRARTVSAILQNPVYRGQAAAYRTEKVGNKQVPTAPEKQRFIPAPALVSDEVWYACQDRFQSNTDTRRGNPLRRYTLSSLMICPACGCRMAGHNKGGKYQTKYYVCPYAAHCQHENRRICSGRNWRADTVEQAVSTVISFVAEHPAAIADAVRDYLNESGTAEDDDRERARIEKELAGLRDKERATITAQVAGIQAGADPAAYASAFADIADKRGKLQERLATHNNAQSKPNINPEQIAEQLRETVGRLRELLAASELTPGEKNGLLTRIVHSITPEDTDAGTVYQVRLHPAAALPIGAETFTTGGGFDGVNVPLHDVKGIGPKKFARLLPFISIR